MLLTSSPSSPHKYFISYIYFLSVYVCIFTLYQINTRIRGDKSGRVKNVSNLIYILNIYLVI